MEPRFTSALWNWLFWVSDLDLEVVKNTTWRGGLPGWIRDAKTTRLRGVPECTASAGNQHILVFFLSSFLSNELNLIPAFENSDHRATFEQRPDHSWVRQGPGRGGGARSSSFGLGQHSRCRGEARKGRISQEEEVF